MRVILRNSAEGYFILACEDTVAKVVELAWWGMEKNLSTSILKFATSQLSGITLVPAVFTPYTHDWRASEASETLSGVYKFELVRYIYILLHRY